MGAGRRRQRRVKGKLRQFGAQRSGKQKADRDAQKRIEDRRGLRDRSGRKRKRRPDPPKGEGEEKNQGPD